jgi:hypothetical protein
MNNPICELSLQCAYSADEANKQYVNIFMLCKGELDFFYFYNNFTSLIPIFHLRYPAFLQLCDIVNLEEFPFNYVCVICY